MNIDKFIKNVGYNLISFKTIADFPDAIILIDKKGYIEYFNDTAIKLFGIDELTFNPNHIDEMIDAGFKCLTKAIVTSHPVITNVCTPKKGNFYIEITASENILGYCISARNVSGLIDTIVNEEKIVKYNSEKNAMISKLENDIKSPITSISGFSKGLLNGLAGDLTEKQAKYISIINNSANESFNFIDKFIEFSNTESLQYKSEHKKLDIVQELKAISKEFDEKRIDKELGYDFNYEDLKRRTVQVDKNAISKIFKNILDVVITNTNKGYITVNLSNPSQLNATQLGITCTDEELEDYIYLSINDTSNGYTEEEMQYLCDPYAQLDNNKKEVLRAFKLGTASILTKRIDGCFNITSENGNGSKYEILIPIEKRVNE